MALCTLALAMTASANVHSAIATQPQPGRVSVQLWLVEPAQAEETLAIVLSALNAPGARDRKSTRLNSSHSQISYAVFCLKKKKNQHEPPTFTITTLP